MDNSGNFLRENSESDRSAIEDDSLLMKSLGDYGKSDDKSEEGSLHKIGNEESVDYNNRKIQDIINQFQAVRNKVFENSSSFERKLVTRVIPNLILSSEEESVQKELKNQEMSKNQNLKKCQQLKQNNKKLDSDLQSLEQINRFKSNIKKILTQEKLMKNQGKPPVEAKTQLIKKLTERSQLVLNKLKPYLEYRTNHTQQQNKAIQKINAKLVAENKIYSNEAQKQEDLIIRKQALKSIYEIQAEIENEKSYGKGLDKFTSRNEIDLQLRKIKNK